MRLFILFILLSSNLIAQKFNQTDSKGLKQGAWRKFYETGRLEFEGAFLDDKPTGIFRYYYDNGSKKALIEHNVNSGRSLANLFHPNVQIMSGRIYKNQLKDSTWITFTESGLISEISNFKNNELHGPRTTYYISGLDGLTNRIPFVKSNYKNGKLDGEYVELFMDGKKKIYSFYVYGNLQGISMEYFRNGNKSSMTRYKNGIKHGYATGYDENGKEVKTIYYYKGRLLTGKDLEKHLNYCKSKGIDPNE
jgi:antitoxin component YwqK of YwqJK toxin-antitoxin module